MITVVTAVIDNFKDKAKLKIDDRHRLIMQLVGFLLTAGCLIFLSNM